MTSTVATPLQLRRLLADRGYRRLLASRFAAQWGDAPSRSGSVARCCSTPSARPIRPPSRGGRRWRSRGGAGGGAHPGAGGLLWSLAHAAALVTLMLVALGLGASTSPATALATAFGLAAAAQVVKLSLDATVQQDIGDQTRGRVFALYDTVFNAGYVVAVVLAATVVPSDGRAPGLLLLAAAVYLLAALAHTLLDRPPGQRSKPGSPAR